MYRLLQVFALPQGENGLAENALDYVVTLGEYVLTLYDSHSEAPQFGYLSPVELPFGKRAEIGERGETPPGERPPEMAGEIEMMIDDLVTHPIAARTGIIL